MIQPAASAASLERIWEPSTSRLLVQPPWYLPASLGTTAWQTDEGAGRSPENPREAALAASTRLTHSFQIPRANLAFHPPIPFWNLLDRKESWRMALRYACTFDVD